MRIDCYGRRADGPTCAKGDVRRPLETREAGGRTYLRYGEGADVPIHRLELGADGAVRATWAYGPWAEAESLEYLALTETKEVGG